MVLIEVSNCAMLPAVLYAVHHQLLFVATMLGVSAVSSAVYHLCDSDVYCLAGWSFHSLQVRQIFLIE
jgi:hypothetical protein